MITFKTMEYLTYKESHELFLHGFEGYFIPMQMSMDAFVSRIGNEGLSPELSIITPKIGGEAVIAMKGNELHAACLVRAKQQFGSEAEGVTLFQASRKNETKEAERALYAVLQEGLLFKSSLKRTTYNLIDHSKKTIPFLQSKGFRNTDISQVFMVKNL